MKILVIDCGSSKTPKIHECIQKAGHQSENIDLKGLNDIRPNKYDGFILSGSPVMLSEVEDLQAYLDKFLFLQAVTKPVMGICFGHQILGLLHGAEIESGERRDLDENIKILQKDKIFVGFGQEAKFNESHQEEISLPEGFIHLATSESCEIEGMKHPEKNLYGFQFHPETSGENGVQLIKNFCALCVK